MPALEDVRLEIFAACRAAGLFAEEAAEVAGYGDGYGRLVGPVLDRDPRVRRRGRELRARLSPGPSDIPRDRADLAERRPHWLAVDIARRLVVVARILAEEAAAELWAPGRSGPPMRYAAQSWRLH